MTIQSKRDEEFSQYAIEVAMSVINISIRKNILKKGSEKRTIEEKGLFFYDILLLRSSCLLFCTLMARYISYYTNIDINTSMQNHKEEFTQFIWKRRLQSRRDLRLLFQAG